LNVFSSFELALLLAGIAQLAIAGTSLLIPRLLGWREETARLKPLTRQVFWTYSYYICATNVAFGLLSLLAPHTLLDGSTLARAVCGFIAAYWTGRIAVQFAVYDRSVAIGNLRLRAAEVAYVSAFAYLALVYAAVAVATVPR